MFGSIVRSNGKPGSDLNLMVIGSTSLRQLGKLLSGIATKLGREVNPHVLSPQEFVRRRKTREHFIATVLSEPRMFVTGTKMSLKNVPIAPASSRSELTQLEAAG